MNPIKSKTDAQQGRVLAASSCSAAWSYGLPIDHVRFDDAVFESDYMLAPRERQIAWTFYVLGKLDEGFNDAVLESRYMLSPRERQIARIFYALGKANAGYEGV